MERLLEDSSRACKEVAAVTTGWVHNTHHSLQLQELRWECLRQEVKGQAKEILALTVEGHCIQRNQNRCEEKLKQLEQLVREQERTLTELRMKWESESRGRELTGSVVKGFEAKCEPPRKVQGPAARRIEVGKPPLQKQELGAGGAKGKFGPQVKGSAKVTFSLPVNNRVPGAKRNSRTTPRSKSAEVQAGTRNLLKELSKQVSGSGRKDRAVLSVSLVADAGQVGAGGQRQHPGQI